MATQSKSAMFLQQQTGEEIFTEQRFEELQSNVLPKNVTYYQVAATEPEIHESVQEEEPIEIECACTNEGTLHMSPFISFPKENNL
jgi:hypothetical protein